MNQYIFSFSVLFIVTVLILYIYKSLYSLFLKTYIFSNYKKVIDLFDYYLGKSYELTYENSIVHWISNGVPNIQPEEKETIERDFIKQTFLLMGDSNILLFSRFFGDESHMINMMLIYVRKRISNDGLSTIIKTASNNSNQIT